MRKPSPPPLPEGNGGSMCVDLGADWRGANMPARRIRAQQRVRSNAIFIAALLLVCGLSMFVGVAAPLGSYGHDTFFFLDNAYRVLQGQVPHRDFSSAWGPIIYLIDAVGLMLSGMRPTGIGYANAMFGALIAIWAFLVVRTRWSSASACAVGIYTTLLINAPFSISNNPLDFGYAMVYNRYGYALFGIIIMECVANAPPTRARMGQSTIGAVSTGVALGLLAFLKISYAIVAMLFVAIAMIGGGAGRVRRLIELCSGFTILAVLVMCYLRFDLSDMLRDLMDAATARQLSLQLWRPISTLDLMQNIAILIFAGLQDRTRTAFTDGGVARFRGTLFALLTVTAGYLLLITNQQANTFPLNGYAAVALAATYGPLATGKPLKFPGFTPGFPRALLLGVCFMPLFMENGISLTAAAQQQQWPTRSNAMSRVSSERGAYLLFRPVPGLRKTETTGAKYVEALNDGLALIRRHSGDLDGVLAFDEFNPFNYLLNRPSPRGGFSAAAYNYVFCDLAHPTSERFFGNARYVIVRKYSKEGPDVVEGGNIIGLMRIYGPVLQSQFTQVEETEHWVLWHRR